MNKQNTIRSLIVCAAAVVSTLLSGCATIVNNGLRSLPVASTPPGATVSIYDRSGKEVSKQTTPFIASLPSKYHYFGGQRYRLVFDMAGYQKSEIMVLPKVSGWYWGNLLFGGLLGMLVIDPATGAMYNLAPNKIDQTLSPERAANWRESGGLMVITTSQATPAELAAMEAINPAG